jgi:pimeloyl-ACP methyl ester carboxylesterase
MVRGRVTDFTAREIELHGHRLIYRTAGAGPPVVLIHGMLNSSRHWEEVALRLAEDHTVIAPDLIGHGDSTAPRGDYSLGAHAAGIRDLLAAIGVDRASIVGHSLGGGVAMQYFWQFPQRVERLALVSSGGLGHDVSPLLRGAALPGVSAHHRGLELHQPLGRHPPDAHAPVGFPGARSAGLPGAERHGATDRFARAAAAPRSRLEGHRAGRTE